jgi:hypothetical protein
MEEQQMMSAPKKGSGSTVGIVVVIIILVLGGIYFWKMNADKTAVPAEQPTQDQQTTGGSAQTDTSVKSDVNDIGTDLDSTSFDDIDKGL